MALRQLEDGARVVSMRRQFLGVAKGTTCEAEGGMPRKMLIILDEE